MNTVIDYHNGICAIDAHYVRPRLAAIHLIESDGRAAIVDTASYEAMPRVLAALEARGIAPEAVDFVILTHIHLDHAGAAGHMIEAFPNARLVVHPRGVRHMVEPSKLMAGVAAVYGKEAAQRLYGELVPVPPERIIEAPDNTVIRVGARELLCIDVPGHARHHIAIVDQTSRSVFTGDTFGVFYRDLEEQNPIIMPATTPVQFDPEEMKASIRRILSFEPEAVYPTHFSRLAPPADYAERLFRLIDRFVALTRAALLEPDPEAALRASMARLILEEARALGYTHSDAEVLAVWEMDIKLNSQGLLIWARGAA